MNPRLISALLMALAVPAAPALAARSAAVEAGLKIAASGTPSGGVACATCHKLDGAGQPGAGIPRLAGLSAGYLDKQLGYFAGGGRSNAIMTPVAGTLSPAQRRQVAAYFASLPVPAGPGVGAVPARRLDVGRSLYEDGDYRTGLLACALCHGPRGLGVGNFSPRIAGQSAAYVRQQLNGWKSGPRDPDGIYMRAEAAHLNQAQIDAVSDYVASVATGKAGKAGKP